MIDDLIPDDLAGTYARLDNWGRWAREHATPGRAESIEGRYRAKWGNNVAEADTPTAGGSTPAVDPFDAQIVGKCLAPATGFPVGAFALLKGRFYYRSNPQVIARHMRMHVAAYPLALTRALLMARNRLTRLQQRERLLSVSADSSHAER